MQVPRKQASSGVIEIAIERVAVLLPLKLAVKATVTLPLPRVTDAIVGGVGTVAEQKKRHERGELGGNRGTRKQRHR